MQSAPNNKRVLCLNFTLKKLFNIPKITAAMLEIVKIWLTTAREALFDEPKKVFAISTKNKLARTSSMLVPKTAIAKEKTNFELGNTLAEDIPLVIELLVIKYR
jgi:hypothetical protein